MRCALRVIVVACLVMTPGGCDALRDRVWPGAADTPAAPVDVGPSEDARALAEAVGHMVPHAEADAAAEATPVAAAAPAVVAGPDELEIFDVGIEWTPVGGGYYGGYGDPPDMLRVVAKGRTRKAVGPKAEVAIKATCDDAGVAVTDTETPRIDDVLGGVLPLVGTEFRVGADLFVRHVIQAPSTCRVVISLRDPAATPVVRGGIGLCSAPGSKTPTPCPRPAVEAAAAWSVHDLQFLPTAEFGFSVVAGTSPAPDRLGVRATCHVGDKHFVEFQYLDARLLAFEPGDVQFHRAHMNSAWEYMRFTDCDLEIQAVKFDVAAQKLLGVDTIGHRCMRPSGLRDGRCPGGDGLEAVAADATGAPVVAEVQNSSFSSYRGWFGAYAMAELTVRAPLPADARFEFIATCGKRVDRMPITFTTPLELVYPGQSLRAQGSVSGRGRMSPAACTTEFLLHTKDAGGAERQWSLARQCYARSGGSVPCPGAPAGGGGGLGLGGVGGR